MSAEKRNDSDIGSKQEKQDNKLEVDLEGQASPTSYSPAESERFNPSEIRWMGIRSGRGKASTFARKLLASGLTVESRGKFNVLWLVVLDSNYPLGVLPIPKELRTDRQFYKIFFIWFAFNFNILSWAFEFHLWWETLRLLGHKFQNFRWYYRASSIWTWP